jgi:hypothetical protein
MKEKTVSVFLTPEADQSRLSFTHPGSTGERDYAVKHIQLSCNSKKQCL